MNDFINQEYITLFDKYFENSISKENIQIFLKFITELSQYVSKDSRKINKDIVIKKYRKVISKISIETFLAIMHYYILDYSYSEKRIYRYGEVKNPEKIDNIMDAVLVIVDFIKEREGK